ncbi:MAG: transcriptional regulator [Acidobacteria bacterium]|nr:transcriptional regulator [Acidobacteriota bacterium]
MSRKNFENSQIWGKPGRAAGERLMMLLKTRGPQTSGELGELLGTTGEAARQQLMKLGVEGLVEAHSEVRGIGRPVQVWSLTEAGNAKFPDAHAELAGFFIRSIREQLGESALDRLIDAKAEESKAGYMEAMRGARGLRARVERLAGARTREGYMAEWWAEGDGYILVENHCPICVAASMCQGFCRTELETFREVLGEGVEVERIEHLITGDRRCAYRISPRRSGTNRGSRGKQR